MNEWTREQLRRQQAEVDERETLELELPKQGPVSWNTIARCAREAGVSVEDWVFDALAARVRMHEDSVSVAQAEVWQPTPERREPIPAWRIRAGECLQRMADRLTDDGSEG